MFALLLGLSTQSQVFAHGANPLEHDVCAGDLVKPQPTEWQFRRFRFSLESDNHNRIVMLGGVGAMDCHASYIYIDPADSAGVEEVIWDVYPGYFYGQIPQSESAKHVMLEQRVDLRVAALKDKLESGSTVVAENVQIEVESLSVTMDLYVDYGVKPQLVSVVKVVLDPETGDASVLEVSVAGEQQKDAALKILNSHFFMGHYPF